MGIRLRIPAAALIILAIGMASSPAASGKTARLKAFDSCGEIKEYRSDHEIALRAPFDGQFAPPVPVADQIGSNKKSKGGAETQPAATSDFSPTNVQEAGVDEPDLVKTDGSKLYVVDGRQLHAVDVGPGGPKYLGSVRLDQTRGKEILGAAESMLISGTRALVFGRLPSGNVLITEVDITDPSAMRVVETLNLEGDFVDARLNGTVVRAVVSNSAKDRGLPHSVRKDWLAGRRAEQGKIAPCETVRHPAAFSGLDMLTVLTIDLAQGLVPVDKDTVMTSGEIVYGSPESLYIATERWMKPDAEDAQLARTETAIHKFDLEGTETVYRATGEVPGYMLSQWSMSEHNGVLRTASTTDPPFTDIGGEPSQSFVSVLAEEGGKLVRIGRVGKIGRGEEIYGLRFIDDMGYVITFRQIDPLYTIDLSNPRAPRVVGELKVPGYSTYLHPLTEGALLAIGVGGSRRGTGGASLSIFDVSNPRAPTRTFYESINGYSQALQDHHAFLYWEPEKLAVIPVFTYGTLDEPGFLGAMGYRVDPLAGIQKAGKLIQGDASQIERTLVIRDRLYSVSETGVLSSDLKTFAAGTWVPFGP